jgi:hypothetical protein
MDGRRVKAPDSNLRRVAVVREVLVMLLVVFLPFLTVSLLLFIVFALLFIVLILLLSVFMLLLSVFVIFLYELKHTMTSPNLYPLTVFSFLCQLHNVWSRNTCQ